MTTTRSTALRKSILNDAARQAGIPTRSVLVVLNLLARNSGTKLANTVMAHRLKLDRGTTLRACQWLVDNSYAELTGVSHRSHVYRILPDGVVLANLIAEEEVAPTGGDQDQSTELPALAELRTVVQALAGKVDVLTNLAGFRPEPGTRIQIELSTVDSSVEEVARILDWIRGQEEVPAAELLHAFADITGHLAETQHRLIEGSFARRLRSVLDLGDS